jgi:GT2 family glycosyltransferase
LDKISIIIVNFNTYKFLSSCLHSISENKFDSKEYEIIIVDNHSSDDSVSQLKRNFPHIKLLVNKENIGFAKANNQAIKMARSKYILLLNPDTILSKNTLFTMFAFMENHIQCAVSTCIVQLPSGNIDDASHRGFPTPWNAICHFSGMGKIFKKSLFFNGYHLGYGKMDQVHEIDSCVGAFMMVRKSVGDKLNWLDPDYFWYGEDLDFCYRVKKAGMKIMYVPSTKIIHFKGVASGILQHSKHLSIASVETRKKATEARFDVMKIFYKKHYSSLYPGFVTFLVLQGISLFKKYRLSKIS